ncbi:MAG TPA: hypothetical protein VGF79_16495 [Bacteroidia bacterium]
MNIKETLSKIPIYKAILIGLAAVMIYSHNTGWGIIKREPAEKFTPTSQGGQGLMHK